MKKLFILLFIAVPIVLISSQVFAAVINFGDDFEDYGVNQTLVGQSEGTGTWDLQDWAATGLTHNTNWYINNGVEKGRFYGNLLTDGTVTRSFNGATSDNGQVFSFTLSIDDADVEATYPTVFFSEGATLGPDLQFFKNGGGLLFLTSNAGTVTVKSFGEASSASAEITLKDFNFGNDTYDIWVDDVLILNNTPFKSDIGELNTFGISGASNSSNVYIDDISAVPEPSTYALFGIGLLGFFGGWIRKKAVSCKH